jgi:hypothetical protein
MDVEKVVGEDLYIVRVTRLHHLYRYQMEQRREN